MADSLDFYFYIKGEKCNQLDLVKCITKISRDL